MTNKQNDFQQVVKPEPPTLRGILLWCGASNPDDKFLQEGLQRMIDRLASAGPAGEPSCPKCSSDSFEVYKGRATCGNLSCGHHTVAAAFFPAPSEDVETLARDIVNDGLGMYWPEWPKAVERVAAILSRRRAPLPAQGEPPKSITLLELWHLLFPEGTHTDFEPQEVPRWLDAYTQEIEDYTKRILAADPQKGQDWVRPRIVEMQPPNAPDKFGVFIGKCFIWEFDYEHEAKELLGNLTNARPAPPTVPAGAKQEDGCPTCGTNYRGAGPCSSTWHKAPTVPAGPEEG